MSKKNLVSCVIPSYRGEKYLLDSIESFLKQDYSNKEIIVVIEFFLGDNSYDLYKKKYSSIPFVKFYIFYEKMTPAKARNIGIELAQGEYICVLDDDDFLLDSTHLSSGIRFLKTQEEYGFVSFCSKILFEGKLLKYRGINSQLRLDKFNFTHSGTIFKRMLLDKVHYYNPFLRFFEDLDLFLRLSQITKIQVLPQLVIKRFHINSISNRYAAFDELFFWFQVAPHFKNQYPGFYFGFLKKIIKCLLPNVSKVLIFKMQVKINSFFLRYR